MSPGDAIPSGQGWNGYGIGDGRGRKRLPSVVGASKAEESEMRSKWTWARGVSRLSRSLDFSLIGLIKGPEVIRVDKLRPEDEIDASSFEVVGSRTDPMSC